LRSATYSQVPRPFADVSVELTQALTHVRWPVAGPYPKLCIDM